MADSDSVLISDNAKTLDVFISYAHTDDGVATDQKPYQGFVHRLVSRIRVGAAMRTRKINLFFDTELASGTRWKPSVFKALESCRLFVPIVSPSWLKSEWCSTEWEAVWNRVSNEHLIGDQTRIVPVSFELDRLLEQLKAGTYSAEQQEKQRRLCMVKELQLKRRFQDGMSDEEFNPQAKAVVNDILDLLDKLDLMDRLKDASSAPSAKIDRSTVFLGFAFSDEMRAWKESVRSELKTHQWDVLEVQFRGNETAQELNDALRANIRDSVAVVHFLEKSPGPRIEGDLDRGIVKIQCDVAKQMEKEGSRLQFFWTGPDLKIKDVRDVGHKEFLNGVSGLDRHMTEPALTFVKSMLKSLQEFRDPPATPPSVTAADTAGPVICVICENGDIDIAEDIQKHFTEKGWFVKVPKAELQHEEQRRVSSLIASAFRDYDYFLFYWGKGTRQWCEDNFDSLIDARRLPGGRAKHPRAALLYCGQEKLKYKEEPSFWPKKEQYITASQWDRFDPRAKEVGDFVSLVETQSSGGGTSTGEQIGA